MNTKHCIDCNYVQILSINKAKLFEHFLLLFNKEILSTILTIVLNSRIHLYKQINVIYIYNFFYLILVTVKIKKAGNDYIVVVSLNMRFFIEIAY